MHPFLTRYTETSVPQLTAAKAYSSPYLVPRVTKAVINVGIGDLVGNAKAIEDLEALLTRISGQKPVQTKARKAIAGFKIRQDLVIGMKVTLRGARMHDFLSKLIEVSLPRTRDFRGIKPSAVTADGNLNLGIRDSMIFMESGQDLALPGLQVTVVSTARTAEEARILYQSLGILFQTDEAASR